MVHGVLDLGIGYVLTDGVIASAAYVLRCDVRLTIELPAWLVWALTAIVVGESLALLGTSVYVAARWPALAVFPALGALWIGVDAAFLMGMRRNDEDEERRRAALPLYVLGAFALAVGLALTQTRTWPA